MSLHEQLPVGFLRQRQQAHRSFGPGIADSGLMTERCPDCGVERLGVPRRYPGALYRDLDDLLEGARQAARLAWKGRRPCAGCGARIPSRTRTFIYAHHASRLARDLLLILHQARQPARPCAFLFSPGEDVALTPLTEDLETLSSDLFHPAVVAYREARLTLGDQPERTVALLERATASDPEFVAARTLLAEVLVGYGRVDAACQHTEKALELDGANPEANLLQGRIEIARGRPGRARSYLERAARCPRTASAALYRLGLVAEDTGATEDARRAYGFALQLDPDNEGAAERLAGLELGVSWHFYHSDGAAE